MTGLALLRRLHPAGRLLVAALLAATASLTALAWSLYQHARADAAHARSRAEHDSAERRLAAVAAEATRRPLLAASYQRLSATGHVTADTPALRQHWGALIRGAGRDAGAVRLDFSIGPSRPLGPVSAGAPVAHAHPVSLQFGIRHLPALLAFLDSLADRHDRQVVGRGCRVERREPAVAAGAGAFPALWAQCELDWLRIEPGTGEAT